MGTKACTGPCGRTLPLDAFSPRKNGAGGRYSRCRECTQVYWRAWYARKHDKSEADEKRAVRARLQAQLAKDPSLTPIRRRVARAACEALIEHGVEDYAAQLAFDLILRGKVPHLVVDLENKEQQA